VTKVLNKLGRGIVLVLLTLLAARAWAVIEASPSGGTPPKVAEPLYLQLGGVGLDPARVYRVRDAALDRAAIHIALADGTIAFTQDVMGRITGAFFEGEGEVLLTPPDEVERKSMSLFTGSAILEERFATAYFRFNDDVMKDLRPGLRAADDGKDFVKQWNETARHLAQADAMRLLLSFGRMLPVSGNVPAQKSSASAAATDPNDRMLHARVQGTKLGIFDIYFDSTSAEQVQAGQARAGASGDAYYDVWTSFSSTSNSPTTRTIGRAAPRREKGEIREEEPHEDTVVAHRFAIKAEVTPPTQLKAEARLELEVVQDGARTLIFELSRFLQVQSVEADGRLVEFIHNPAVEGTQLSRRGNDMVAVILPAPASAGQKIELRFVYSGDVLSEEGKGLLYVGARGTWYPNRGLQMADFDLEFHYPAGWTLVATGRPMPVSPQAASAGTDAIPAAALPGEQVGRWVSDRPLPVAGFNLGKYVRATAQAGNVMVESYATVGVERDFPSAQNRVIEDPTQPPERRRLPEIVLAKPPSPARNAMPVAEASARAVEYYAQRFGPFPYSRLSLTQIPGRESQGWPGLVFLSSYAFLSDEERRQIHMDPAQALLDQQVPAHEAAHQWWGDLILWRSYRDQWFSEGLANYCSLMMLQEGNPAGFRLVMQKYRQELAEKDKDGSALGEAGPVTLGARLFSSHFPEGYAAISYGRGTWLFHMLRSMMQDAASENSGRKTRTGEEPFVLSLRKIRQRFEGRSMSTRQMLEVFAEDLPASLQFEGRPSLDWFLDGWINGTALPRFELQAVKFTPKGNGLVASGIILQKDAPNDLVTSVPIYSVAPGRAAVLMGRVFADGPETPFHLSAPAGTRKLLLDPGETILTGLK
jgi:Peptidase family M1 domain